MIYENNLHFFSRRLSTLLKEKGMVNTKGEPDKIALYNALHKNDVITDEDCKKDRQAVTDKTRTVSNWIKGNNYPRNISDLISLCTALNCNLDYFFTNMDAPTHDLEFISKTIGLSSRSIEKLISYDNDLKNLLNNLIDCKEFDKECDFLYMLLVAMLNYGMSRNETKIILKDTLFYEEKEIADTEIINAMLKYSATQIFDTCLDYSSYILRDKKNEIRDNNLKLETLKREILLKKLAQNTGKTEEEILAEIKSKNTKPPERT